MQLKYFERARREAKELCDFCSFYNGTFQQGRVKGAETAKLASTIKYKNERSKDEKL